MESVQVEIFGQTYSIKGKDDTGSIRDLAAFVNARMMEVQKGTGTSDPLRVAILTAMTISDELFRLRAESAVTGTTAEKAAKRLLDLTEQAGKRLE
jgi:cell division protein ZapA (FtsZ GTPase activity inhibitor)